MKHWRKFTALALALLLAFSLSSAALATNAAIGGDTDPIIGDYSDPNFGHVGGANHTITIVNAPDGATYKIYRLFNAEVDSDGNVKYTLDTTNIDGRNIRDALKSYESATQAAAAGYKEDVVLDGPFTFDPADTDNASCTVTFTRNDTTWTDDAIVAFIESRLTPAKLEAIEPASGVTAQVAKEGKVTFTGNPDGYFFITCEDTGGNRTVILNNTVTDVIVEDKLPVPAIFDKFIRTDLDDDGDDDDANETSVSFGETVDYQLTAIATNYGRTTGSDGVEKDHKVTYYKISDVLPTGLQYVNYNDLSQLVTISIVDGNGNTYSYNPDATDNTLKFVDATSGLVTVDANNNVTAVSNSPDQKIRTEPKFTIVLRTITADDGSTHQEFDILIPWGQEDTGVTDSQQKYDNFLFNYNTPSTITVDYQATVTSTAAVIEDNTNTAELDWRGISPDGEHKDEGGNPWVKVDEGSATVHTYAILIKKVDANTNNPLPGAQFALFKTKDDADEAASADPKPTTPAALKEAGAIGLTQAGTYLWDVAENQTADGLVYFVTTPESGVVQINGIKEGTYYAVEIVAPAGYNPEPKAIAVEASGTSTVTTEWKEVTYYDAEGKEISKEAFLKANGDPSKVATKNDDGTVTVPEGGTVSQITEMKSDTEINAVQTVVTNGTGSILPSTGGIGTTIFYVAGSLLIVAAAVFFVTKRRVSVR